MAISLLLNLPYFRFTSHIPEKKKQKKQQVQYNVLRVIITNILKSRAMAIIFINLQKYVGGINKELKEIEASNVIFYAYLK